MPFLEAIASLQARKPQLIPNGANFKFSEYIRAFSISGISKIDTLVAYQSALEKALAKGQSFNDFVKANPQLVQTLNKKRLERVFKYNLIYANTRGKLMRYESAPPIVGSSNGDGWYYVFHSRRDNAARHLAFDNVCLPRKHPFWQNHTPPLDWGCRCELQMWSERQIKGKGIMPTKNIPQEGGTEAGGFERDNNKFLATFFKNKLANYANNSKATSLLKGVLQNIASKKARFKSLLRLSQNGGSLRFGVLETLPIQLKSKTLKSNPANDLFDFFLAREVLDNPLLVATHKDSRKLVGQKLGRWYELQIQGTELTGLEHFKEAPVLKEGFKIQSLDFDELAKRLPSEKPYPFTQRVLATIKSALALLSLDEKQEKHVLDSPGYIQGRSYYTKAPSIEEVRGWIEKSLKIDLDKKGKWDKHGIISHPDFEGIVMPFFDKSKAPVKVYKSKLHFNKKGLHIVPTLKGSEHD
ncbi:polymorphic toxin type 50 domain-containing protein [Helicobacter suis]|uniref:polymorphic toxin type 50 domain-containing protein n=1 Tax=Helicobacter suis TaxID=104628 RepID=UPI0013D04F73|nr:polymorphic toxin type 50 domain-containing protein [Helicobacter suis]